MTNGKTISCEKCLQKKQNSDKSLFCYMFKDKPRIAVLTGACCQFKSGEAK